MDAAKLMPIGFALTLVGFFVVAVGAATGGGGSGSAGGFVLIGPVPIIFGSGPNSGTLVEVGALLTVVMVAVYLAAFLAWRSRVRRARDEESE